MINTNHPAQQSKTQRLPGRIIGLIIRSRLRIAASVLLAIFLCGNFVAPTQALEPEQRRILDDTVLFFNSKDDAACGAQAGGGSAGAVRITLRGTGSIEQAFNYFVDRGLTAAQSAGIIGNLMAESGVNPKSNQKDGAGRGIAQWSEGDRWDTNSRGNVVNFARVNGNGQGPEDLGVQLDFLWFEMNSVAPWNQSLPALRATTNPSDAAAAFERTFERPLGYDRPQGSDSLPKRKQNAIEIYKKYSGATAVTAGTSGAGCQGSASSGNVVQKALELAWPDRWRKGATPGRPSALTPKPEYSTAMQQYNRTRLSDGADCGVFVATVMIASGVDPDYPKVYTPRQYDYMAARPGKYQDLGPAVGGTGATRSGGTIQPGDILVKSGAGSAGHIWIYVGKQPGGFGASASFNSRSGNIGDQEISGNFSVFRPIQGAIRAT